MPDINELITIEKNKLESRKQVIARVWIDLNEFEAKTRLQALLEVKEWLDAWMLTNEVKGNAND